MSPRVPMVAPMLFDVDPAPTDHGFCASMSVPSTLQPSTELSIYEIKLLGVWEHEGFFKVTFKSRLAL